MKILIIAVGTLKEQYWSDAIAEYEKRLSPYCSITIAEIKEERFKDIHDKDNVLKREGDRILRVLPDSTKVVALDKSGKQYSSREFAQQLGQWTQRGQHLSFVIGGALGLSQNVLEKANTTLSLSKMTFTHQMTRVILVEQIYRALTILHGKVYHY